MRLYLLLFCFLCTCIASCSLYAQEYQRKKDSSDIESQKKVTELKEKSEQRKFTKFLTRVLSRDPNRKAVATADEQIERYLKENQGKTIRNIKIITLNPFGYSVIDSKKEPKNWLERTGNNFHIKSSKLAIRNYLLFRKNQSLDSLSVMESERILREQNFIRRVHIEVDTLTATADSVDVKIRVLDSWSTFLIPSLSGDGYRVQLKERNFVGLGHTFNNKVMHRTEDGKTIYSGNYLIPNIYNTHISSNIRFSQDLEENYYKKLAFDRPFYTVSAKWAGGVEWSELYHKDSLPDHNNQYQRQPVKYFQQHYWGGHSFPLIKNPKNGDAEYRLISSLAYETRNYSETPEVAFDSIQYYSNERHLLFKLALSSNRYIQDRYVFRHNEVEDIPVGRMYAITAGTRRKRHHSQLYMGLEYSFGTYHRFGYLSGKVNAGSYFNDGKLYQGALNFKATYFTPILDIGSWRLRQFITYDLLFGINRDPITVDRLNLLGERGLSDYNETVYGNKKAILTLQTQSYAPWAWLGFRFNPYLSTTFGVVAEEGKSLYNSQLHTKIGVGVLITNDYFVVDRIQLSISYYPHIPSQGNHILNFNSLRNDDIYFSNFNSGRPEVIPYIHPREREFP